MSMTGHCELNSLETRHDAWPTCPHDCHCEAPKPRPQSQQQPSRRIRDVLNREGFVRKTTMAEMLIGV
jgi:hypothetical protein